MGFAGPTPRPALGRRGERRAAWAAGIRLGLVTAAVACLTAIGGIWWWVGFALVVAIAGGVIAQRAAWWWAPMGIELAVLAGWHLGWLSPQPAAAGAALGIAVAAAGPRWQARRRPGGLVWRRRRRLWPWGR